MTPVIVAQLAVLDIPEVIRKYISPTGGVWSGYGPKALPSGIKLQTSLLFILACWLCEAVFIIPLKEFSKLPQHPKLWFQLSVYHCILIMDEALVLMSPSLQVSHTLIACRWSSNPYGVWHTCSPHYTLQCRFPNSNIATIFISSSECVLNEWRNNFTCFWIISVISVPKHSFNANALS